MYTANIVFIKTLPSMVISVIIYLAEDTACPPGSQHAYQGPVLKVSAFNIQIFGKSKFKKEEVVSTLVQVSQCL